MGRFVELDKQDQLRYVRYRWAFRADWGMPFRHPDSRTRYGPAADASGA